MLTMNQQEIYMDTYKEKYEQALERAKKITSDMTTLQSIREFIFPELKESEDEKIRKDIIDHFKYEIEKMSAKIEEYEAEIEEQKKYISWFEKQGEQKSVDKVEPKFKVGDETKTESNEKE